MGIDNLAQDIQESELYDSIFIAESILFDQNRAGDDYSCLIIIIMLLQTDQVYSINKRADQSRINLCFNNILSNLESVSRLLADHKKTIKLIDPRQISILTDQSSNMYLRPNILSNYHRDPNLDFRPQFDFTIVHHSNDLECVRAIVSTLQMSEVRNALPFDEPLEIQLDDELTSSDLTGKNREEQLASLYGENTNLTIVLISSDFMQYRWNSPEVKAALKKAHDYDPIGMHLHFIDNFPYRHEELHGLCDGFRTQAGPDNAGLFPVAMEQYWYSKGKNYNNEVELHYTEKFDSFVRIFEADLLSAIKQNNIKEIIILLMAMTSLFIEKQATLFFRNLITEHPIFAGIFEDNSPPLISKQLGHIKLSENDESLFDYSDKLLEFLVSEN